MCDECEHDEDPAKEFDKSVAVADGEEKDFNDSAVFKVTQTGFEVSQKYTLLKGRALQRVL